MQHQAAKATQAVMAAKRMPLKEQIEAKLYI